MSGSEQKGKRKGGKTTEKVKSVGKRFAYTQASAQFGLHLSAETIRLIIHHTAEGVAVQHACWSWTRTRSSWWCSCVQAKAEVN